jgi:SAM-dependent methyltransferase
MYRNPWSVRSSTPSGTRFAIHDREELVEAGAARGSRSRSGHARAGRAEAPGGGRGGRDPARSADALPFPDGSFDVVVSSLMFHHLDAATKRGALREWRRVLAPGGALVLVDFGAPRSALLRVVLWPVGLFEHVTDNLRGRIPALLDEAGFACREVGRYGGRGRSPRGDASSEHAVRSAARLGALSREPIRTTRPRA